MRLRGAPARRVLLHVGMGKTGSSALQVAFVRNRDALARRGVTYPAAASDARAAQDGVVSGNAVQLQQYLVPRKSPEDVPVAELLDRAMRPIRAHDGRSSLLFSSEFLHQYDAARLAALRDACEEAGYQLSAVGYVRDLAGHALSDHSQRVKRHRMTESFGEFLADAGPVSYRPGMREWIEGMHQVLGPDQTTVVRYDAMRGQLVRQFFQARLGIRLRRGDDPVQRSINRSLTAAEIDLMRAINAHLRSGEAGMLASDLVIAGSPVGSAPLRITRADLEVLTQRFDAEVSWINDRGVEGGPLRLLPPGMSVTAEERHRDLTPEERLLVGLVAELANRVVRQRRRLARQPA